MKLKTFTKNVAILVLFLSAVPVATLAGVNTELSCQNQSYRDAQLQMTPQGYILIQDSFPSGTSQTAQAIKATLGLKGDLTLGRHLGLRIISRDLDCQEDEVKGTISCQAQNVQGSITTAGWIQNSKTSGMFELDLAVEVKDFTLQTTPLQRGSDYAASPADDTGFAWPRLNVEAEANVLIGDELVHVKWDLPMSCQ